LTRHKEAPMPNSPPFSPDRRPLVGLALGDPAGIGPEIALKAALDPRTRAMCRPVLFGDRIALARHASACGLHPAVTVLASAADAAGCGADGILLVDLDQFRDQPLELGATSGAHGLAAIGAARAAIQAALAGEVAAVVACPQTEIAIKMAGIEFDGYPSFVARETGVPAEDAFLMLCFDDKRVVHTTLHVGVARAVTLITAERVERVLAETHKALRRLGITTPRIAVSGLNPHAGEHGMFGMEEIEIIAPAIATARATGLDVDGPFGADTMFHKFGYDAFVVMLHDQGHLAAKLLATNRTAGMTIGTPIVFSSVAHGSALDIAGQNRASPEAVVEALRRVTAGAAG
jgi:4-hydroxy-L-threonine phosphate dehydrogenase PdxA